MDKPVRILVVDDEPLLLRAALRLLKKVGYEVWEATISGEDLQLAKDKLPDLILQGVQVEEALRKRTAQLEALRQINLGLTAELDLHGLLHSITENAVQLLEGTAGAFYLHRPELDLLEWVVAVGPNASSIGTVVQRGEGLPGQVWQTGDPLIVDDYQQWAGELVTPEAGTWGSVVGVPVRYGREADEGEFVGVLNVMVEGPRSFSSEDVELLSLFASQAAVVIHNAHLYKLAQGEITEREQAQEELRQERDLVSRIMETSPIGIVVLNPQGRIVYANPQVAEITGLGLDDMILRGYDDPMWRLVGEDGRPLSIEQWPFMRVMSAGEPIQGERIVVELESGAKQVLSVAVAPLTDESGQISRLVAMVEDITARVQAESALRESEARYRKLVETSPDAITLTDLEGNVLACNQRMAALHGFESTEAVIGYNVLDLAPPEELRRVRENRLRALLEGNVQSFECILLRKDGSRFPAELSASALFDESGKPQAFMGVTRDITERVQSRAALRESEERLRSTLSSMDDLVFALDKESRFIDYHQPATAGDLYVPPEEFLGKTVSQIMPSEVADRFQEAFDALLATHQVQHFDYPLTIAGEMQWFSAKVSARLDREGVFDGVTVVSRDITERKQAQERIEASLQEKEVLLKEIHHRVKNNLQVISSLLDMQALSIQNPEAIQALEDSRHRVRIMAFVHERLYQSEDLASIGFREYMERLSHYLLAAYERGTGGIRLNLQVEDVYLDLDTAMASGLIVNELVSNALKHAFPPGWEGEGEICIELCALDAGRLELQVTDNGVGFPPDLDLEGAETLGLRLINMLTQQIQGTLELDRSAGTTFRITFPGKAPPPSQEAGLG